MTTPRIVLHIGGPKTGSTFLQRAMRAEPAAWRANGVYVPVQPAVERIAGNAKLLAAVLGGEAPAFPRAFPRIDLAAVDPADVVAELLADWQPERETLLLSAENLDAPQAQPVRDLLPRDAACTVVLFVRNQHRWLESYYREQVKNMLFRGTISELTEALLARDGGRYYPDWHVVYEAWHDAFDDTRVVVFEEARDLLAAFATTAELPVPPDLPLFAPENVAPDGFEIAYLLALDEGLELREFKRRRRAAGAAAARTAGPVVRFLSPSDRERIRDRFEPGNRRLLELLGRRYEGSALDLGDIEVRHTPLDDVYRSEAYREYAALADSIYAGSP